MRAAAALAAHVSALRTGKATVLVAIDGPGGAGKSHLARAVARELEGAGTPVSIVAVDDFFLPSRRRWSGSVTRKPVGADFDWRRLRAQVLAPLGRGHPARYDVYDWSRDELAGRREVPAGRVILVEGVTASRRALAGLYDLRVWVECPRELRLARGIARDGEAARGRWRDDWIPSEDRYVREHAPRERADVVVDGRDDRPDHPGPPGAC